MTDLSQGRSSRGRDTDPTATLGSRARRWLRTAVGPGGPLTDRHSRWLVGIAAGLVCVAALIVHLFYPTTVGMGDQGDGQRLVCQLGVANVNPFDYGKITQHIYTRWVPHQWYGEACGAGGSGERYLSSQLLLLWPGKWLTPLLGWGSGLDTRAVGIVSILILGFLITALVALLPGRPVFRLLTAAAFIAISNDGVFADFFISPYSETACFLGVLGMFISMLFMWRRGEPGIVGMLLFTAATMFTVTAKTQMIAVVPAAIIALLWRPLRRTAHARNRGRNHTSARGSAVLRRTFGGLLIVGISAVSLQYAAIQPKRFEELNTYNAVFVEMLPNSPDPAGDLAWFGLPRSWASSSGTTVASTNSAIYHANYPQFLTKVSEPKIVLFYAAHPARLVSMANRGLTAMTQPVLGYIGSYTQHTGTHAWQKEHRFPVVEWFSKALAVSPLIIVVLHLIQLALGVALAARRRSHGERAAAFGLASVVIIVATWVEFWAVMLSEGASEIYKHMIVADYLNAMIVSSIPISVALLRRRSAATQNRPSLVRTPHTGAAVAVNEAH